MSVVDLPEADIENEAAAPAAPHAARGYAPGRGLSAMLRRRAAQSHAGRPATLAFARPILSICFDGFPKSALDGARRLEALGGRGAFYVAAGLAGREGPCGPSFEAADLARLAASGHEIGCHTFDHVDCANLSTQQALKEFAKNRDALADLGHAAAVRALAYPYGETRPALKRALPARYTSARGARPGLNIGKVDLVQLHAYPLYGRNALKRAYAALPAARRQDAWLIAFAHDVACAPSRWGVRGDDLGAFIAAARAAGFELLPVSEALERAL